MKISGSPMVAISAGTAPWIMAARMEKSSMNPEIRYGILYNQHTWQWNVVMWRRNDPLDAWQGQAIGGHKDQKVAEEEAKRLNQRL